LEQPLPPNGSCNLGSIDISKFLDDENKFQWKLFEKSVRLGVRFLDAVIDKNVFPTLGIEEVSKKSRQIGLGIMGLADYYLRKQISYGSDRALAKLEQVLEFMYEIAEDESIKMGQEFGVPEWCNNLPVPRRNITLLSIAPTGTISLIAGCNSGIEPVFSEITVRNDKTGSYQFENDLASKEYFRCAVSANGAREVSWEEHVKTQASSQKFVDSGVSKTINFPNHTQRETVKKAFIKAWEMGCRGITAYRNGSRKVEVLSPKNVRKDKCPQCGEQILKFENVKKCSKCDWSMTIEE